MTRRIEYIAPDKPTMYLLARQVCQGMADMQQDESYNEKQIVDGLANYLHVVGNIEASYLSSGGVVDNGID